MSRAGVSLPGSRHVCQTQQKSTLRLHDNRASPVSRNPSIAVPGFRLTGLRFFHVIAFAGSARLLGEFKANSIATWTSMLIKRSNMKQWERRWRESILLAMLTCLGQKKLLPFPSWLTSYNTGLKVISAQQSSLANWASPARVIRP